eukprot:gene18224-56905_t
MPSTLGGPAVHDPPSTWLPAPNGWALVTHSRWFEADNEYVTGDAPGAAIRPHPGIAISTDKRFFRHIFSRAKEWGMVTYEQDFLVTQYENSPTIQGVIGAGRSWLSAMSAAAESENVTIQYCMSLPRHILQSASFPRVTQAHPFWSEVDEGGNPWGARARELDPELQALVSSLIAGPVGVADGVGFLNATRVMQTCRADGTLLKPDRPAYQLDSTFARAIMGGSDWPAQDNGIDH